MNGYIAKIKSGIDIDPIVEERATSLRDQCADIIDSIVRASSPLYNNAELRFGADKGIKLYRSIVDRHFQEVLQEEVDINNYIKSNFGFLSKFMKYEHN